MKNYRKKSDKLTRKDYDQMWGEDGPYSQVSLKEQIRILDDSISRVFLVVEAEINPFTFEYILKNKEKFIGDEPIIQLLDHAEYRGEHGYVVSAGEVELEAEGSHNFARKQTNMTTQTLIRMHEFVINEFNLRKENKFGTAKDKGPLIWNENTGGVEIQSEFWSEETRIGSPAGVSGDKARYFIVLAFDKDFDFKSVSARSFAGVLSKISTDLKVDIENCESFMEYVLITAFVSFDVAPSNFIELVIERSNKSKKKVFQKDYFVTNIKRPTQEEILTFLKQLPLDKDIRMKFE